MNINLITPAAKRSRSGNRVTAVRWARHLTDLGHRVEISEAYGGEDADLLIAVHAWRSAESVRKFRARYPDRPVVVGLAVRSAEGEPSLAGVVASIAASGVKTTVRWRRYLVRTSPWLIPTPSLPSRRCSCAST